MIAKYSKLFGSVSLVLAVMALAGCNCRRKKAVPATIEDASDVCKVDGDSGFGNGVGNRVFFAFDSSELTCEGKADLERQADYIKKCASGGCTVIEIVGRCDARGTQEYNLALGMRRARAAAEALRCFLQGRGVQASVKESSLGKENPVCVGTTEEAYRQNRNATTVLVQASGDNAVSVTVSETVNVA